MSATTGKTPDKTPNASAASSETALHTYVVTHINEAIDNGWVRPYYQPVVRTLTGKLCGLEALARWEDPEHGIIPPNVFIPALEESRIVHLLDCSIVRQVCQQYRTCVENDYPIVPVSFNLSRLDFDLCDIFSVVENAAHEYNVPRRMLNVEITETTLGTDPDFMTNKMRQFRNAGYQVWMDDFGSGYSTLNVLKDFDFNELKIDMEFLNRFGEKSKTILASVVDMSKKLGIQTLAEGVETQEHLDYLRRIGCEKMQGYLFGKPTPYSPDFILGLSNTIGVESAAERLYLNDIGAINTLSLSERDLTAGNSTQGYVTSMSLAIVEYFNDTFTIVDSNRVFREGLANVGVPSISEAERMINDVSRQLARQARQLTETIETNKFGRVDYVTGGIACVMRVKHITTRNGRIAMLVSIDDALEQSERKRHERMDELLETMYSIYDHVDIIHLDEGFIEPVFGNVGLSAQFDVPFDEVTRHFAKSEVYVRDRPRYIQFMDHATMVERIQDSGEMYLVNFFRFHQHGGNYVWKLVALIYLADQPGNLVMYLIRNTHWTNDGLFQAAYDNFNEEDLSADMNAPDFTMTDGSLWRALARGKNLKLFWKDSERRFVSANQAFIDYYGFESVNDIVGKTDEDIGWHIDPTPFQNDEWRVLREGISIENAPGHCISHGEDRDIVANKRPVYRNGRIVGLVGYFVDVGLRNEADGIASLPTHDSATGVLNFTGLEAATWRFVDAYRKQKIDFAMLSVNVESFESINAEFGYEFGDKVLKRVADELVSITGNHGVVGHVFADRFVILVQEKTDEELQSLCKNIEERLLAIAQVEHTPCTVYAFANYARYSDFRDVEAMKRYNRDLRVKRRGNRPQ